MPAFELAGSASAWFTVKSPGVTSPRKATHTRPITGCLSSNSGSMGEHFADLSNFGVHGPARPQALLFEPERDGSMRLVGVEFIVLDGGTPGVADSAPPPPLFGQSFHYVAAFDVWGLHAWAWRNNPRGMFADWNPMVSCQYAS